MGNFLLGIQSDHISFAGSNMVVQNLFLSAQGLRILPTALDSSS